MNGHRLRGLLYGQRYISEEHRLPIAFADLCKYIVSNRKMLLHSEVSIRTASREHFAAQLEGGARDTIPVAHTYDVHDQTPSR